MARVSWTNIPTFYRTPLSILPCASVHAMVPVLNRATVSEAKTVNHFPQLKHMYVTLSMDLEAKTVQERSVRF